MGEIINLVERSKEMKDFFNEKIDSYDELHLQRIKSKEKIVDFIPSGSERIIDLGSGTGLQLIKVYKEFPNVHTTAIDVSDEMLRKLKERNISDKITIVNESFFDYDFGTGIDAVISTQALHHFEPSDKLVLYKKVFECLRDGGVFVNEDYFATDDDMEKQGFEDYKNLVKGEGKHYDTPLTIEHEIEILNSAGFSDIQQFSEDDFNILISKK